MKSVKSLYIYLIIWSFIALIFILTCRPHPIGEWDDYSLVTASLIHDRDVDIDQRDVDFAKRIFPSLQSAYEGYQLSGYKSRGGGELSWYFCTYSVACVPAVLLLIGLNLDPSYGFYITNIVALIIALCICIREYENTWEKKMLLILSLTLNPVFFYMTWISAEVFVFSLVTISVLWWTQKKYKRSALMLSLASTLNPTILALGFVMILDFFCEVTKKHKIETMIESVDSFIIEWKNILSYGICYIPALIPFAYNYYEIGHINLTAASFVSDEPKVMIFKRFLAYIFDWNFGILPYYNFLFLLSIVFLILAVIKRKWKYVGMMIGFYGVILGYSIMPHINSGMSGIARYNAWSAVILIFGVISYLDVLLLHKVTRIMSKAAVILTAFFSSLILYNYGPVESYNANYINMTPIASFVLDYLPEFYSPLHSTFNSRVKHVDGGYTYTLPIAYQDKNGNVRKILVDSTSVDHLKTTYFGEKENDGEWFEHKVSGISKEEYISIPIQYEIFEVNQLELNQIIFFSGEKRNCESYVKWGISGNENSWAWTDGKKMPLCFTIKDYNPDLNYNLDCNIAGVYGETQSVMVYENNTVIYKDTLHGASYFRIPLSPNDKGVVKLNFVYDDAVSPSKIDEGGDTRMLSLKFVSASLIEE